MSKHLIIGRGEVGSSLANVLSEVYEVDTYDIKDGDLEKKKYDVMHICIPYLEDFEKMVNVYMALLDPSLCIIHSTITPEVLGMFDNEIIVYSPVRGIHPKMEASLKTFVKFVGGKNEDSVNKVIDILRIAGVQAFDMPLIDLILMKLLSTTQYGIHIAIAKWTKAICDKFGANYSNVYTSGNRTYNAGYRQLGMPYVQRPILYPPSDSIDSHCIIENAVLLDDSTNTDCERFYRMTEAVYDLDIKKVKKLKDDKTPKTRSDQA